MSRLIIIFVTAGYVLETWYLAENTTGAMKKLLSLGISIGTFQLTVGLVVSVAACLYGFIVLSYAVQALLNETTYKKHQLEHGVKVSISKIIHYVFILIGFLLVLKI